jgi:hypothetical protein
MKRRPGTPSALVLGTVLLACCAGRGAVGGRIIDAAHESVPIPGDFVAIKRERGIFLSEGGTRCDAEELTTADSSGQFHFKSWSAPIKSIWDVLFPSEYFLSITAYKRGFTGGEDVVINDQYRGVVALEGHEFAPEAELEHIRQVALSLNTCGNAYEYRDAMKPLVDALKADAARVAATPKQLSDATSLLMSPAEALSLARQISPARLIQQRLLPPPTPAQSAAAPR